MELQSTANNKSGIFALKDRSYRGTGRIVDGALHLEITVEDWQTGTRQPLEHICRHGSTGFNCGNAGPGAADTAYSILADLFDKDTAEIVHQGFQLRFLSVELKVGKCFLVKSKDAWEWLQGFQK
jgi:hypothetical protein